MPQYLLAFVFIFFLSGCVSAPLNYNGRNAQEEDIIILESHITDNVSASSFSSEIVINEDKRSFSVNDKKVFWLGFVENFDKPYSFVARWIYPDGNLAQETNCSNLYYAYYTCSMAIPKNMDASKKGEWKIEVYNRGGGIVQTDRFRIGLDEEEAAFDIKNFWTNPDYDISKADAIILNDEQTVEMDERMWIKRRVYKKIRILTEEGKRMAEVIEPFISSMETVEINFAHTILPDGKVVSQKDKMLGTISRFAPSYTASQALIMTMPSVEVGSTIEYEITFRPLDKLTEGLFSDEIRIADSIPKSSFNYKIVIPDSLDLKIVNLRTDLKPEISQDAASKTKTYLWTGKNIEPIVKEVQMPPYRKIGPSIFISTANDWKEIGEWWRNLTSNKYAPNQEIQRVTNEIVNGSVTAEEKIDKIFKYIQKNIRYVGFDFGRTVYEPAPAEYVFKNKYGDCKNQSVLLKTMLNLAGIPADIVLVRTSDLGPVDQSIAGTGQFNHAIVAAYDGDKKYFLDPTIDYVAYNKIPYSIEGSDVLIIKDDDVEFQTLPISDYQENSSVIDIDMNVAEDLSAEGTWHLKAYGQSNIIMKLYYNYADTEKREQMLRKTFKQYLPTADITDIEFNHLTEEEANFDVVVKFKLQDWLIDAESLIIMRLFSDEYVDLPEYVTDDRQTDVYSPFAEFESVKFKINLPPGIKLDRPPKEFSQQSNVISSVLSFHTAGSVLEVEGKTWKKYRVIKKEELASAKQDYKDFLKSFRQNIFLKRAM